MKSLLTALQEGRLIELPDTDKTKSLEYLATLIEAIPDIGVEGGITEGVLNREQQHNTGIGKGWACPHARTSRIGELVCSVGWSPKGIDYGAPDGAPVHLMVMYFVPDVQKNAYLKEISSLAKAIMTQPALQDLQSMEDLSEVRHHLLDAINAALESMAPDARARMIQLEVKQAGIAGTGAELPFDLSRSIVPLSVLSAPGLKAMVLCQDRELVHVLESSEKLVAEIAASGRSDCQGNVVLLRSTATYQPDRVLYDCLVVRPGKKTP
jgi:mannitol/fructose-specific phosphotransferase system IIA component (Ntr-type)